MATFGIIGIGNMGLAILSGLVNNGFVEPQETVAFDIDEDKGDRARDMGSRVVSSIDDLVASSDTVMLAVKPQQIDECLAAVTRQAAVNQLFVSIAAGISTGYIEDRLGDMHRVVRVMPNTPAQVGAGAAALCAGQHATQEDVEYVRDMFATLGEAVVVDEPMMDWVTALSASGPAYFYYLVEAMERAATDGGLPQELAERLARQTFIGAARLLEESGEKADVLRHKVTSKGGTTEAALRVMEQQGVAERIAQVLRAAADRSQELGR